MNNVAGVVAEYSPAPIPAREPTYSQYRDLWANSREQQNECHLTGQQHNVLQRKPHLCLGRVIGFGGGDC